MQSGIPLEQKISGGTQLSEPAIQELHVLGWRKGEHDDCFSSLQLIARIADNPRIAKYIVAADLRDDALPASKDFLDALSEHFRDSGAVSSMLKDSPYLKDSGDS